MPHRRRRLALLMVGALVFSPLQAWPEGQTTTPAIREGLDFSGMDLAIPPGDGFFDYANGGWLKATQIPADRPAWSENAILADLSDRRTVELIQTAGRTPGAGSRKIDDFYAAYMDEAGIEAKGLAPLAPELSKIASISDLKSLSAYLGSTVRVDVDMLNDSNNNHTPNFLGLWVAADLDQPSRYAPFLVQGGLSLPNADYYLDQSPRMAAIRSAFLGHVAKVMTLAGISQASLKGPQILGLETAIARSHASTVDIEDPAKGNNHWSRSDLQAKAPGLDWSAFLEAAALSHQSSIIVWTPTAIIGESALVASEPIDVWKAYLALHLIDAYAGVLPKAFADERYAFYDKTLSGVEAPPPRWRRAVAAANGALGEEIGRLYAAKYFSAADKAALQSMVVAIKAAFSRRIDALTWMDAATKREAHAKLEALIVGVGYPDKWRDYSGYDVVRGDAFGNAWRSGVFNARQKLAWLHKPVDRAEWVMTPQTVNAVNLPVLNALNFPAAELQSPHFDARQPAAVNYGAVGSTIGHEISHSFDNTGSLFDSHGRMHNWWTKADLAYFLGSSEGLAKQYDRYCPFPDLCVHGQQTLSENIADLAGVTASYDAWRASLGAAPAPTLNGLSGAQQFFLSFAQTFRSKQREQSLRRQILTNGHAPSQYRALTVRNLDAWYRAFSVEPGQSLFLPTEDRVRIW